VTIEISYPVISTEVSQIARGDCGTETSSASATSGRNETNG